MAGQTFNPKKAWKSINNLLLGRQNKPTVVNEINQEGGGGDSAKRYCRGL